VFTKNIRKKYIIENEILENIIENETLKNIILKNTNLKIIITKKETLEINKE
jgi:hypothetical protein